MPHQDSPLLEEEYISRHPVYSDMNEITGDLMALQCPSPFHVKGPFKCFVWLLKAAE
jgi:hypothetical protein